MHQLKKLRPVLILLLCTTFYIKGTTSEEFSDLFNDEQGGNLDNAFIDSVVNESIQANPSSMGIKVLPTPERAVALLQAFMIIDLLRDETLFLHTNPFNKRNILDDPLAQQTFWDYPLTNGFSTDFFLTSMDRAYFTDDSDSIDSYLALSKPSFVNKLQIISDKIIAQARALGLTDFTLDIGTILTLFKDFTAQERQLGFIFSGFRKYKGMSFRAQLPFYYLERNFYATEEEEEEIEKVFGVNEPSETEILQREHLICDKIGFGDLRLSAAYQVIQHSNYNFKVGGLTTLPTNVAIIKGLLGSSFPKSTTRRTVDIRALLETSATGNFDDSRQTLQSFAFGALDHLAANLLETSMGNGRHFSLGAFMQSKIKLETFIRRPWATNFNFKSLMSLEYLFPAQEQRFFIKKISTKEFDSRNFTTGPQLDNLDFLETKLVDFFYPFVVDTLVSPGLIVKTSSILQWRKRNWGFAISSNFWLKTEEGLRLVQSQPIISNLDVDKGVTPLAFQGKVMGSLFYKMKKRNHDLMISLNVEGTTINQGIGEEVGLSFKFETNF